MDPILFVDVASPTDPRLAGHLAVSGFGLKTALDFESARGLMHRESIEATVARVGSTTGELGAGFGALGAAPLLAVCAERSTDLVVRCLEAGADAVLTEPVSRRELAARLRALLRPPNRAPAGEAMAQFLPKRVGELVVDPGSHAVSWNGQSAVLTPTEFRLLLALARREGEVASHEDLLSEVWGPSCSDGQEKLRLYVRYLRRKLQDDDEPQLLLNERGMGYRLATSSTRDGNGQ